MPVRGVDKLSKLGYSYAYLKLKKLENNDEGGDSFQHENFKCLTLEFFRRRRKWGNDY